MKDRTRSFYESIVQSALQRIWGMLDEALDLNALAREAALSPLHFHRIFRGLVGETPLEVHRRLRLERAAFQLSRGEHAVTRVAFDAGYETHESFTRAFREAYACSPSEFRAQARAAADTPGKGCGGQRSFRLPARCSVHFSVEPVAVLDLYAGLSTQPGAISMLVNIKELPEIKVAAVPHQGPYNTISEAFARLGAAAGRAGLFANRKSEPMMLAIYHDVPETTPTAELRSEACISVDLDTPVPAGLSELRIPAGKYAQTTHIGPYSELGDVWARLMGGWLPASGYRVAQGMSFEIYRNTPETAPVSELRTELYVPLAEP